MLNKEQSDKALRPMTAEEFRKLITLGHDNMQACREECRIRYVIEDVQEFARRDSDVSRSD